jgi:glutamate-1-semialdehyde 2,1-aminomutase
VIAADSVRLPVGAPRPAPGVARRPDSSRDGALSARAREICAREWSTYVARTPESRRAGTRAKSHLPLGVPSSFQTYDPNPLVIRRAQGSRIEDVDGNRYLDLMMGFGSLFAGHVHPSVRRAIEAQLDHGTLFVSPCEANVAVARSLAARYHLPLWRFTNSGTEATMDAIRVARGVTGREKVVKVEGGYHGHHDQVLVSMKPPLALAGSRDAPRAVPASTGITRAVLGDTRIVPYNDADALERALAPGDVACFIVEPVMQNIGICVPRPGYLEAVRAITARHGTLLLFDEVKAGITAGWHGATGALGVRPDLVTLAKSIGGGLPLGAFGGTRACMEAIDEGRVLHLGTYNGNPLCMAAARAVLDEVCTPEATATATARNRRLADACRYLIRRFDLPAHVVELGAKGCVTWARRPVADYRDYAATDFDLAFAQWLWSANRGVLLPPGLDEQWLISVMHTDDDVGLAVEVFRSFAEALTR